MGISKHKGFRMRRNKKTERTGQLVIDAGCSFFGNPMWLDFLHYYSRSDGDKVKISNILHFQLSLTITRLQRKH